MVLITLHGGVNEIGGNKFLLEFGKTSLFLDFGLSYDGQKKFFEAYLNPRSATKLHDLLRLSLLPKINGVYRHDALYPIGLKSHPNVRGESLWHTGLKSYEETVEEKGNYPDAVFLSHAHLDHSGYIPYLGNISIICTETTQKVLDATADIGNLSGFDNELTHIDLRKVEKLSSGYFPGELTIKAEDPQPRKFKLVKHNQTISLSDDVKITAFEVGHSIPGSMACLIEHKQESVVYTGDLRFHGRSGHDLRKELDGLKPDVMLCEGTRIDEKEPDDEYRVEKELIETFSKAEGLAIVTFAWKDLERYETVKIAAKKSGRIPVFDPRIAYLKAQLGESVYKEGAKVFLERSSSMLYSPGDYSYVKHKAGEMPIKDWDRKKGLKDTIHLEKGITALDLQRDPHRYVLHLDFFRFQNLIDINPPAGSVFVRAQTEPFNPEMELSHSKLVNWLKHFGLNKDNKFDPIQTHASGHASGTEIQELIDHVKPKVLIPIHTNYPRMFKNDGRKIIITKQGKSMKLS